VSCLSFLALNPLRKLVLQGCNVDVVALMKGIEACPTLQEIKMVTHRFFWSFAETCFRFVSSFFFFFFFFFFFLVYCVFFFQIRLKHDAVRAKVFAPLRRLRRLSLVGGKWGPRPLAKILSHNACLQRCSLSFDEDEEDEDQDQDQDQDEEQARKQFRKRVGEFVSSLGSCCSLKRLKLGATFREKEMRALQSALQMCPLVEVDLSMVKQENSKQDIIA
jgi:hypothetical protein